MKSGLASGKSSAGVFSIAPFQTGFIVVGGDFESEAVPSASSRFVFSGPTATEKGAFSGFRRFRAGPTTGYRSGAACLKAEAICIAVGPTGIDQWAPRGWRPIVRTGYDAIDLSGRAGWVSGDAGRIARVEIGE